MAVARRDLQRIALTVYHFRCRRFRRGAIPGLTGAASVAAQQAVRSVVGREGGRGEERGMGQQDGGNSIAVVLEGVRVGESLREGEDKGRLEHKEGGEGIKEETVR